MIEKYFEGTIPKEKPVVKNEQATAIRAKIKDLDAKISANIGQSRDCSFSLALEGIWELINMANKHVEDMKPWNLARDNKINELKGFIILLVEVLKKVEQVIFPFMPQTAESIRAQLGTDKINKGKPLFPRIENLTPGA
jgi:methionyl-tRNA synthetase